MWIYNLRSEEQAVSFDGEAIVFGSLERRWFDFDESNYLDREKLHRIRNARDSSGLIFKVCKRR